MASVFFDFATTNHQNVSINVNNVASIENMTTSTKIILNFVGDNGHAISYFAAISELIMFM